MKTLKYKFKKEETNNYIIAIFFSKYLILLILFICFLLAFVTLTIIWGIGSNYTVFYLMGISFFATFVLASFLGIKYYSYRKKYNEIFKSDDCVEGTMTIEGDELTFITQGNQPEYYSFKNIKHITYFEKITLVKIKDSPGLILANCDDINMVFREKIKQNGKKHKSKHTDSNQE